MINLSTIKVLEKTFTRLRLDPNKRLIYGGRFALTLTIKAATVSWQKHRVLVLVLSYYLYYS